MRYFTTAKATKKRDQCISRKQAEIEKLKVEVEKWKDMADSVSCENFRLVQELMLRKYQIREVGDNFLERHKVVMATNEMLMESLASYAARNLNPSFVLTEVL